MIRLFLEVVSAIFLIFVNVFAKVLYITKGDKLFFYIGEFAIAITLIILFFIALTIFKSMRA